MNQDLIEQIVLHIYSQFAIIPSSFVDLGKTKSLRSKEYLLLDKLTFELDDNSSIQNRVWGCQLKVQNDTMTVLLGDCTLDKEQPEFALIFSTNDTPTYGLYLCPGQSVIAYSLNDKDWLQSSTYLQATFLAAMEQIRELGMKWEKSSSDDKLFSSLKSFIQFKSNIEEAGEDL